MIAQTLMVQCSVEHMQGRLLRLIVVTGCCKK